MTDAHVGRLVVAAIHQAIADELPVRVEFYEHWLCGERVRDGGVGLAAMTAVLGFLRVEGGSYHDVMRCAGEHAAEWAYDAMPLLRRKLIAALPRGWRARLVLGAAGRLIHQGYERHRVTVRLRRQTARVEIRDSLFCQARETQAAPLCDFHAALIVRMLAAFALPATSRIESCLAMKDTSCVLMIDLAAEKPGMRTAA